MSASDVTVGYPVHAVAEYREWENQHRAKFTDWKAACGATGTQTGHASTAFGLAGSARRLELCRTCWPTRDWRTNHPKPIDLGKAAG